MVRIIILFNLLFPFRSWLRQFFLTTLFDNPAKRWDFPLTYKTSLMAMETASPISFVLAFPPRS